MRIYTESEAQATLPEIVPLLEKMSRGVKQLRAERSAFAADARGVTGDGNLLADPWADEEGSARSGELLAEVQAAAAELETRGIEVKDPERGLIDFHWEREGELVYLCYLLGEPEIRFWHRIEDGFAGRQPIR